MSAFELALAVALLLVTGGGVGLLLCRAVSRRVPWPVPFGGTLTVLLGLFAVAAAQPNLFLLGAPRWSLLALAYGAAFAGYALAARGGGLRAPDRAAVLLGLGLALLLEPAVVLAATRPVTSNDALLIWWPKVREVAAGAATDLHTLTADHVTPFYPRGMAWLASTAAGWNVPDAQLQRLLPVVFTWLCAMALAAAARRLGAPRGGMVLAALFVALPEVARQCHAGLSDVPVAAAILAAGVGLTCRREHPAGVLLAVAAALGAASIKEEGALVLIVVAAFLVGDAVRRPHLRRAALAGLAAYCSVVPFAVARAAVPRTRLDTAGVLFGEPDMLLRRVAAVAQALVDQLVAPGSLLRIEENAADVAVPWTAWVVFVACAMLVPRSWPRRVVAAPAVVVLLAALAIQACSSVDVRWHMRTTLPRLVVEIAPLLLLAALGRMRLPRAP